MGEGESLRNERRPEDALEPYERALRIWEGIVRDRPAIPSSVPSWPRPSPRSPRSTNKGDAATRPGTPGDGRSTSASCPATATRASHSTWAASTPWAARSIGPGRIWADRALAALREALASGYKDRRQIRENPDLDPLRGRPDFMALITDMTARKDGPSCSTGAVPSRSGVTQPRPSPSSRQPRRPCSRSSRHPRRTLISAGRAPLSNRVGGRPSSRARARGTGRAGCNGPRSRVARFA